MKPIKNTNNCHSRENGNPAKTSVGTGNPSRHCEEERRSNPLSPNANGLPHSAPLRSQGQTHHHRPSHGFTLVELIVVITILVVLGTIAFTSLSGFAGGARDSSRVSDLSNLSQGLELTSIKTGSYPNPDDSFSVTYSGGVLWTQGTVGDTVINILGSAGAKFSRKPMDPLTTTTPYTYSKLAYGNAYQLKTDWEGNSVAYFISQTYASSGNPTLAYIKGTYNGMVAKTQSGSTIFLLAVPSIITTQSGELNSAKFLIHGQTNSGGLANAINPSKLLIYSSGSLPSSNEEKILFASGIALAYSGTALASQSNIASYITALKDTNTGALASLGGGLLSASLGGSTSTTSGGGGTNYTCATNPSFSNLGTLTTGTPTSASQTWAYNASNTGPCTYVCINGYSGNSCATPPFTCGTSTVSDIAGNSYNTVSIAGTSPLQCWMASNLRTTKNPDGTDITKGNVTHGGAGWATDVGQYSCPPNSANTAEDCTGSGTYGLLYQWSAAMNTGTTNITDGGQGICPNGWHVPTNTQWKILVESQATTGCDGGTSAGAWECSLAGSKLAGGSNWTSNTLMTSAGFGSSGFNVQPSGFRTTAGNYYGRANYTYLWSSTALDASSAWRRHFSYSMPSVSRGTETKALGVSVRCLKD